MTTWAEERVAELARYVLEHPIGTVLSVESVADRMRQVGLVEVLAQSRNDFYFNPFLQKALQNFAVKLKEKCDGT